MYAEITQHNTVIKLFRILILLIILFFHSLFIEVTKYRIWLSADGTTDAVLYMCLDFCQTPTNLKAQIQNDERNRGKLLESKLTLRQIKLKEIRLKQCHPISFPTFEHPLCYCKTFSIAIFLT